MNMTDRTINLELLLGRRVLAVNGRTAGRMEEICAEPQGDGFVVTEYHLGAHALLERLSASGIARLILGFLGLGRASGYRVPWDKLDVSDLQSPRLTCSVEELERLKP